MNILYIVVYVE